MTPEQFDNIELGQEIVGISGPGQFRTRDGGGTIGKVIEKVVNRWGRHLVIETEDGKQDTVHSISKSGIGWYLLE